MSLDHVKELARQFTYAANDLARDEEFAELDHYNAMLETIKAYCASLTPLVGHIAKAIPKTMGLDYVWHGVHLPSCDGYLLASGKIYLPTAGPPNGFTEVRDPTYTVVEILDRRQEKDINTREQVMMGLITDLQEAFEQARAAVGTRQQRRTDLTSRLTEARAALSRR